MVLGHGHQAIVIGIYLPIEKIPNNSEMTTTNIYHVFDHGTSGERLELLYVFSHFLEINEMA
jgi:hypothetical protein